jgi:predicted ribonuclease YlaK
MANKRKHRVSGNPALVGFGRAKTYTPDQVLEELDRLTTTMAAMAVQADQQCRLLRMMGVSYGRIGKAAGMTAQSVHVRYRDVDLAPMGPA